MCLPVWRLFKEKYVLASNQWIGISRIGKCYSAVVTSQYAVSSQN